MGGFRDVARYHSLGLMELFGMRLVESQKRPSPPSVCIEQSTPADAKLWRQGKAVFDQMTCHVTPKKKLSVHRIMQTGMVVARSYLSAFKI